MNKTVYRILLIITVLAFAGGVVTLIPRAGASYPNVFGYKSVCTFAPAASFFCFFIAGMCCFLRATFIRDREGSSKERFRSHAKSLVPVILVLAFAVGLTFWFTSIKSQYPDETTSATQQN